MGAAEESAAAAGIVSDAAPDSGQPDPETASSEEFLPGLALARDFYDEVIEPLLAEKTPGVPYAAALIGPGSDVLGFDTPISRDHDWGPRLQLFLPERELRERAGLLDRVLASELPSEYRGFPTSFTASDASGPALGHARTTVQPRATCSSTRLVTTRATPATVGWAT